MKSVLLLCLLLAVPIFGANDTTTGSTGFVSTTGTTTGSLSTTGSSGTTVTTVEIGGQTQIVFNVASATVTIDVNVPQSFGFKARYSAAASDINGYVDPKGATDANYRGVSFFFSILDSSYAEYDASNLPPSVFTITYPNPASTDDLWYYSPSTLKWSSAKDTCSGANKLFSVTNTGIKTNVCHFTQFAVVQPIEPTTEGAIKQSSSEDNAGIIAAAVIVPVVVVGALILAIIFLLTRKTTTKSRSNDVELTSPAKTEAQPTKEDPESSDDESSSEEDEESSSEEESSEEEEKPKGAVVTQQASQQSTQKVAQTTSNQKKKEETSSESESSSEDSSKN